MIGSYQIFLGSFSLLILILHPFKLKLRKILTIALARFHLNIIPLQLIISIPHFLLLTIQGKMYNPYQIERLFDLFAKYFKYLAFFIKKTTDLLVSIL